MYLFTNYEGIDADQDVIAKIGDYVKTGYLKIVSEIENGWQTLGAEGSLHQQGNIESVIRYIEKRIADYHSWREIDLLVCTLSYRRCMNPSLKYLN